MPDASTEFWPPPALAACRSCNDVERNPTLAVYSKRIANFKLARGSCQQVGGALVLRHCDKALSKLPAVLSG